MGERAWKPDLKDYPADTESPNGGVAVAQISDNEFIVIGQHARVKIEAAGANTNMPSMWGRAEVLGRVEEGHFDASGKWVMERNWNGDQVDFGLNLTGNIVVLKVKMGTY
jgi:beta-galactosidase GanA